MKNKPFGMHLMFDAYDCDPEVLNDANKLYDLLDKLPPALKMRSMIKPYIVKTPGYTKHDPGGWSGFVLIEESHISFHTFVKKRFVTLDIYTCKEFDTTLAIKSLKDFFKTKNIESSVEIRGRNYPEENID
jgi:S-adenosylmethionine decarboxylase